MRDEHSGPTVVAEIVKTEDRAMSLLPLVPTANEVETNSGNSRARQTSEDDRKSVARTPKRTRFFLDAVVITKRNPEARLDPRYQLSSSIFNLQGKRRNLPFTDPAVSRTRNRRKLEVPKREHTEGLLRRVKTEPREVLLAPVQTTAPAPGTSSHMKRENSLEKVPDSVGAICSYVSSL
ncbi:hypothetical protein FA13DRAFT_685229 [Coprinellus micaceus]|uniref:Uncharacterized protein n=1 Tax=Coprinellus micaceus TaxID=71717 RepID=A0A4Y7T4A5_COPMI|nr:hypothetical protein FA13DRAFT_685229 [Coprinellus micaceus]